MDIKTHTVNGNKIILRRLEHNSIPWGRCCHKWTGKYQIMENSRPVSTENIETLKDENVFGCGQIVEAHLVGTEIHYSGTCDSGD